VADLHFRRGEAKLSRKEPLEAATEFHAAATLFLEKVGDKARALQAVERALASHPTHVQALELKAELALDEKQYTDAAAAMATRVQQGGDARSLSAVHARLGAIYQDHLADVTRAAAHLQTALSADPQHADALERLANIHTLSKNWTGAADCLKRLLELNSTPHATAQHSTALGRIYEEGFGDAEQAIGLYRKAIELDPANHVLIDTVIPLYERTGKLAELASFLDEVAQKVTDPQQRLGLLLKTAQLYAQPLGKRSQAIDALRRALALELHSVPARAHLAELLSKDASSASAAIDEHRQLLKLQPERVESWRALHDLWKAEGQVDRAFCAAGALVFLRSASDVELSFYNETRNRLPPETQRVLSAADLQTLVHPEARGPILDIVRAIGDQFSKLRPPPFAEMGIDRKADRLKPDHAVYKAVRAVVQPFGVTEWDLYQAKRGGVRVETTDPLSICVEQDVARRFSTREQRFLIGRAAFSLFNKAAVLKRLSVVEAMELIGNSVRIHVPTYPLLGKRNDDASKQLRKAYSRKTLKALEAPAAALARISSLDFETVLAAIRTYSEDRAGLLMAGDVAASVGMILRSEAAPPRIENGEAAAQLVRDRADVRQLLLFAVSDEHFQLRKSLGVSL
jgi:tetratricopeptide (TPR) repeat protein